MSSPARAPVFMAGVERILCIDAARVTWSV